MRRYLIIFIPIILLATLSSCQQPDKTPPPAQPPLVKTMPLTPFKGKVVREFPGVVVANNEVDLAFQVNGQLIEFPIKAGNIVKKGDLLGKLDQRDYKNAYDAVLAEYQKTEANYKRAAILVKSGTIAEVQYDEMFARLQVTKSRLDTAKKQLDDTVLLAPFSGLVARTYVDNFQTVQAKDKILSLQDVGDINIEVNVPEYYISRGERQINKNLSGQKLGYVIFPAFLDKKFKVTVKKYETQADPVTQTYLVTLMMLSPKKINILPGMTTTWYIEEKAGEGAPEFLVPVATVLTDENGKRYVWRIDPKTMQAKKQIVNVGKLHGKSVLIAGSLKEGEKIITAGMQHVVDGMKVRVYEPR